MSNATHGNSAESTATTFRIYDRLPPDVREVVRNSFNDWGKQSAAFLAAQPRRLYGHWFDNFPARRRSRL